MFIQETKIAFKCQFDVGDACDAAELFDSWRIHRGMASASQAERRPSIGAQNTLRRTESELFD